MKKKHTTLVVSIIILSMGMSYFLYKKYSKRLILRCSSDLVIKYPDGYDISANFTGFIYSDGSGFSTYRGVVIRNDKVYILNRDLPYQLRGDNAEKTITYMRPIKKNNDTTPDDIVWSKMYREGSVYYLSFYKTPSDVIIAKDRGTMTYVCSAESN